jgi:hypothetical protein
MENETLVHCRNCQGLHHGPDVFEWAVKVYGRSNIYWGDRRDRLYYTAEWCRSQQYIARQMERPRVVAAIGA